MRLPKHKPTYTPSASYVNMYFFLLCAITVKFHRSHKQHYLHICPCTFTGSKEPYVVNYLEFTIGKLQRQSGCPQEPNNEGKTLKNQSYFQVRNSEVSWEACYSWLAEISVYFGKKKSKFNKTTNNRRGST